MIRRFILLMASLLAAPSAAQIRPHPDGGDPHLQVVDYADGQILQLMGAPGYQLMLELSPDEQVHRSEVVAAHPPA